MVEIKNALFFPVINIITILTLISYKICDINIHVIPHTHLDPGWLNTPEEYYENERIEEIFDTIMNNLDRNKDRTFVINELFYFKKWYSNKSKDEKENFKKILEEKRIEFVSGGFVVNDEATPSYNDIMDQVRIGHQFLLI